VGVEALSVVPSAGGLFVSLAEGKLPCRIRPFALPP